MSLPSRASLIAGALLVTPALAAEPPDFQGRYIAAISDGDMRAYAYIDGQIGEPRGTDALSLVALPLAERAEVVAIEVPNTVINPVFSIAAAPDGNTVFVAETHTRREVDDRLITDLQGGTMLRAVDVSDPANPRVIGEVAVGVEPQGVSVSLDGRTLVLATKTPATPLSFVSWSADGFGAVRQFGLGDLSPMTELIDQGLLPHHAEWHPSADIIAVTLNARGQTRFFQVQREESGAVTGITPWGNPVQTSKWPMSGKFSRDGRFFVTNDLQWGADVRGFYVNAPPSQLTSIELAPLDAETPRHFVVGGASVPRHAESLAFSNGGDLIATLNIGQTWLEPGTPGHSQSSVSLVRFDTATGAMRHLGDWPMTGILPEGIAFDASDRYLVAGVFEYDGPEPRASGLEIWRVLQAGGDLALRDTGYRIPTGPGAHSLIVVAP